MSLRSISSRFSKAWNSILRKHFSNGMGLDRILQMQFGMSSPGVFTMVLSQISFPEYFGYAWSWLPYSPELNPCDFALWGYLRKKVNINNPHTVYEWRHEISSVVISINQEILTGVMDHFQRWVPMVLDVDGAHIENVFTWLKLSQACFVLWYQNQFCMPCVLVNICNLYWSVLLGTPCTYLQLRSHTEIM